MIAVDVVTDKLGVNTNRACDNRQAGGLILEDFEAAEQAIELQLGRQTHPATN